jgi:thioredoxin 1
MNNTVEEQSAEPKRGKMNRRTAILAAAAIVIVAGALLFYFLYLQNPGRLVLAKVNDEEITLRQFNKEIAKVEPVLIRDMFREDPGKLLDRMIVKALLLQEAKKQGVSAPVQTYKDAAKTPVSPDESIIIEFIGKKFSSPPEVKREEIEGFYKVYKDKMDGKSLKQMAPAIEQYIREAKRQEALEQYLVELRKNAKVDINQARLQKMAAKAPEMDTEEDLKKALTSGKPVLVDFGANSCLPCRQMRPVLKEVGTEYSEKARVLVIDAYKNQNLVQEFKVFMLPTLVFFDSKGKEAFRNVGIMEKEKIVGKLKEIGMGT